MKIVLASHYFHPHIGGIESVVESHATRLSSRGHDVTVLSSDIGASQMAVDRDGYRIMRYKAWNPAERFGIPYPIPYPPSVSEVANRVFAEDVDVLHVHGMNYLTTSMVLRYAPSLIPVLLHQHTPYVDYPLPIRSVEYLNDRLIGGWNLSRVDHVFCVSADIEEYVTQIDSKASTELMVNGIDTESYQPRDCDKHDVFNCGKDDPVFFTLSRMSQKKGVDTLLEGVNKINQKEINVHVAIAGDGPMKDEVDVASQRHSNLEMMGTLTDDELRRCYAAADVFLFTSKSGEAFPTLTMMEAYASGTPVIASKLSEGISGVSDGENSVLVEPGNADELVEEMINCANNSRRIEIMSENARKSAERHFAIESRIDRLEECYQSVSGAADRKSSSS